MHNRFPRLPIFLRNAEKQGWEEALLFRSDPISAKTKPTWSIGGQEDYQADLLVFTLTFSLTADLGS
jgi:hypothetical protein